MRTCVIFNPTAKGDKARHFRRKLDEIGAVAELKMTTHPGAARELAAGAVTEGFQTIVAAGGDGTLNEVANGIGDAPDGYMRARFGILPLGTVNVFALELGIPFEVEKAWPIILAGKEQIIDLPEATFRNKDEVIRRRFLQMAGAGWDARAVELISWKLKKRIGRFAYIWAGLGALKKMKSKVHVQSSAHAHDGDFILIGNGRFYAGKYPFFYEGNLADGKFDVTVFPEFHWKSMPACMTNFVIGRYFRAGAQPYFQAHEIELTSPELTPLQLDGELVGHLPAKISILPKTLRVIVP
jgi:diacylglycerol kinase (ATP)